MILYIVHETVIDSSVQSHALLRRGCGTSVPFIDESNCVNNSNTVLMLSSA